MGDFDRIVRIMAGTPESGKFVRAGLSQKSKNIHPSNVVSLTLTGHNEVMTEKYTDTFQGLLDCEYYSIGVTGAEALVAMLDDYNQGRLNEFLLEQEITHTEFMMTVNRLAVKWASEGKLNLRIGD